MEIAPKAMPTADIDEIDAKLDDGLQRRWTSPRPRTPRNWPTGRRPNSGLTLDPAKLTGMTADEARHALLNAYDQKYRPEMHRSSGAWCWSNSTAPGRSTCSTMDHLRSGVGLRGYAQEDPKIVYKREGMKEFDAMWEGVRDRVTEAVFRMEEMGDEEAQAALWAGARATHEAAISAQQARRRRMPRSSMQTNAGGEAKKAEPIRNIGEKVGRNDPCPCGSGKKYKNCHMKLEKREEVISGAGRGLNGKRCPSPVRLAVRTIRGPRGRAAIDRLAKHEPLRTR